jgi:hypothetical protein
MAAIESDNERGETLLEFLVMRARASSDARLAIDAVAGFTVGTSAALWRGPGWKALAAAGLCFLCFGVWGIADRELRDRPEASRTTQWLGVLRIVAGVLGLGGMIAFVLFAMAIALGTIIS